MINLDFWFLFLGFLLMLAGGSALVVPEKMKKIFKQIFKDENHIRAIAIWYLTAGPLAAYSGWLTGNFFAANLILVIGVLFTLQGILLFFETENYQEKVLNKVLKLSSNSFRFAGSVQFLLGLVFVYYGLLFL
jgi:uncharacterized protein YjeT (DUF2065 family)